MDNDKVLSEIISRCQAGDEDAFARLVDMYAARCYAYFYRLTGDRRVSDDLLSDLMLKLVEKIGLFKKGSFEKWLFTIASNIFYDYLRQQYRRKKLLDAKVKQIQSDKPPLKHETEMIDKLQRQMAKLDIKTAELLMLRYYSGLSFKDIAEMRSEPIGTTLSKVHRGLKKLKEMMEKDDD